MPKWTFIFLVKFCSFLKVFFVKKNSIPSLSKAPFYNSKYIYSV